MINSGSLWGLQSPKLKGQNWASAEERATKAEDESQLAHSATEEPEISVSSVHEMTPIKEEKRSKMQKRMHRSTGKTQDPELQIDFKTQECKCVLLLIMLLSHV